MFEGVGIVIPRGEGRHPLRVARCLGAVGAQFVLLSHDRENVARMSTHCSSFLYSHPHSDSELLDQLLGMDACGSPEIILPVTTDGFLFAARNREALRTRFRMPPMSTSDSLTIASDKWTLYEFARRNQIPVLRSTRLSDLPPSAVKPGASTLVFPALVKSRRKEGGDGARRVESGAELTALVQTLGSADAEDYFVQRFVAGHDVSLSAFCENGEIRSYTLWKAVFYGRVPYRVPLCVSFGEHDRVLEIGRRLLRELSRNQVSKKTLGRRSRNLSGSVSGGSYLTETTLIFAEPDLDKVDAALLKVTEQGAGFCQISLSAKIRPRQNSVSR